MSLQSRLPTVNTLQTTVGMAPSLPKSYKVAVFTAKDEPLSIEEVALQQPAPGELLVKVEACGVGRSEEGVQSGLFGNGFPVVPGHEVIGKVVAVGDGKGPWKIGDRVGGGALSSSGAKERFALELGADEYLDASQGDLAEGLQRLGGAAMVVCTAPNPKIIGGLVDGLEPQGKVLILSRES